MQIAIAEVWAVVFDKSEKLHSIHADKQSAVLAVAQGEGLRLIPIPWEVQALASRATLSRERGDE